MVTPKELKYAKTHEWVRVEGELAFVGITDYAQESLGDIVYVEPPEAGQDGEAGRGGGHHRVGQGRLPDLRPGLRHRSSA